MIFHGGVSKKQKKTLENINKKLRKINPQSGIYILRQDYHGKIYRFQNNEEKTIFIGSSNFSNEGLNKRLEGFENELKESEDGIKFEENAISTSKESHKKYEGDLKKVRNNREYNSIIKEQEFQELEIKLSDKKIAQFKETIETKTVVLDELKNKIKDRKSHLKSKNSELGEILKDTEKRKSF